MKLPLILVGTSPFIGAGQFGRRAYVYYKRFYGKPQKVREVLEEAYLQGVRAVQALLFQHILEAILLLKRDGLEFKVWASLQPYSSEKDLTFLKKLEVEGAAIHGETSDSLDVEHVSFLLKKIKGEGYYAGMAIHSPKSVIPWLLKTGLDVDFIIVPFNKLGVFMDVKPNQLLNLLRELGKPVMAMKTLAAGLLNPAEALKEVFSRPEISSAAIGVASREEAAETFKIALKLAVGRG